MSVSHKQLNTNSDKKINSYFDTELKKYLPHYPFKTLLKPSFTHKGNHITLFPKSIRYNFKYIITAVISCAAVLAFQYSEQVEHKEG